MLSAYAAQRTGQRQSESRRYAALAARGRLGILQSALGVFAFDDRAVPHLEVAELFEHGTLGALLALELGVVVEPRG